MNDRHLITLLVVLGILYFWNKGKVTSAISQVSSSSISSGSPCDNLLTGSNELNPIPVGTDENAAMFQNLAGINEGL